MRFGLLLIGAASAMLLAAPAAAVGKKPHQSWGKADVSFADYRADSLECSNRAYGVDVVLGPLGPAVGGNNYALDPDVQVITTTYIRHVQHAANYDAVTQLQAVVDSCLVEKGYRRFELTRQQMATLHGLEQGTPERQHYLHSLGSNASVLAAQGI